MRSSSHFPFPALCAVVFVANLFVKNGSAQDGVSSESEALVVPVATSVDEREYVPAAMGVRTDQAGNSWNLESNGTIGRVGSAMVNGGLALSINGSPFVSQQPLMTPDGQEFVLRGTPVANLPDVKIQRRIRLLGETGTLRYAEMLYNGSADPVVLNVTLETNFSGNYQTYVTDRGRTEPVLLEGGETGLVVLPGATQSTRAFLFVLSGGGEGLAPTISSKSRYALDFTFPVRLPPGGTAIVVHHVAQVVIPQNFDRRNMQKLFRPHSFAESVSPLPDQWRPFVVNAELPTAARSDPAPAAISLLGIEPGPRDILAVGAGTRLVGDASGGPVSVNGAYGKAEVSLDRIAAIAGEASGHSPRLFLRDRQVLVGALGVGDVAFARTAADAVPLSADTLDRIVLREGSTDAKADNTALIETYRGDRLAIDESSALRIEAATAWGSLSIPLDEIARIVPAGSGLAGHLFELRDGTRCLGMLSSGMLEFQNDPFGTVSLPSFEVSSITGAGPSAANLPVEPMGKESVLRIQGDQVLVGRIVESSLTLMSGGVPVDSGLLEIRRMERIPGTSVTAGGLPEEIPSFLFERWDGGTISGFPAVETISLAVAGATWSVPLRDVVRIDFPFPELGGETIERIGGLIADLGSAEWEVREKATRDLAALGSLARPVLRRELSSVEDPEVVHRIERVLALLD